MIQRLLEHSLPDLINKVYTNLDPVLHQAIRCHCPSVISISEIRGSAERPVHFNYVDGAIVAEDVQNQRHRGWCNNEGAITVHHHTDIYHMFNVNFYAVFLISHFEGSSKCQRFIPCCLPSLFLTNLMY